MCLLFNDLMVKIMFSVHEEKSSSWCDYAHPQFYINPLELQIQQDCNDQVYIKKSVSLMILFTGYEQNIHLVLL